MNNIVFIKYKKRFCLTLMIGLFILINGIALSITKSWNSDHIIALVLGNLLLVAAYFILLGFLDYQKNFLLQKMKWKSLTSLSVK